MKELQKIQTALKAPKNQLNKFGGYNYRSCEDILEAVKPHLAANACSLTISDDIVLIGNYTYVKATATIKNEAGETESVNGFARHAEIKKGMDDSQLTGATSSYARKYALNGLFCIDDTKDADATNDHGKGAQNAPAKAMNAPKASATLLSDAPRGAYVTNDQRLQLAKAGKDRGLSVEELSFIVYDVAGAQKSALIPADKYDAVLAAINSAVAGKVM